MEKKLLLQEIAEIIANKEGLSKKKAETFCRLFFEVVEEGLITDKYVKIKGFGTFKLVPVGERESVDVNTGERIQISGHSKISFTPDPLIKDLVNKPFAHFQTVVINEDTDMEELENVVVPEEVETPDEQESEETVETAEDATPEEPTEDAAEAAVTEADEEAEGSTAEDEEPEVVLPPLPDDSQADEVVAAEKSEEEEATEEPQQADTEVEDDESAQAADDENTPGDEPDTDNSPAAAEEAEDEADAQPAESAAELPDADLNTRTSGTNGPVRYIVEAANPSRRPNWWKIIALTLFVFILMILSYFAGYYGVFCPLCNDHRQPHAALPVAAPAAPKQDAAAQKPTAAAPKPNTAARPAASTDTAKTSTPTPPPAPGPSVQEASTPQPAAEVTYSPSVRYTITGTKRVHTIKSGENLYAIARRTYGHKEFAAYIIRYNKLENPDNIVVGTTLKLPELQPEKGE